MSTVSDPQLRCDVMLGRDAAGAHREARKSGGKKEGREGVTPIGGLRGGVCLAGGEYA